MTISFEISQSYPTRDQSDLEILDPSRVRALHRLFDRSDDDVDLDGGLSILDHWVYFWNDFPTSLIGDDGHEVVGDFLREYSFANPRRMYAGGEIRSLEKLEFNTQTKMVSKIEEVVNKNGRSGAMVFVTIRHEIFQSERLCRTESQRLVYLEGPSKATYPEIVNIGAHYLPRALIDYGEVSEQGDLRAHMIASASALFRFSALTYNSHRIHLDRQYCQEVDHYPGLVVHGPLLAMAALEVISRMDPSQQLRSFDFRAHAPVFEGESVELCAKNVNDDNVEVHLFKGDLGVMVVNGQYF